MGVFANEQAGMQNSLIKILDFGIGIQAYQYFIPNSIYIHMHYGRTFINKITFEESNHDCENKEIAQRNLESGVCLPEKNFCSLTQFLIPNSKFPHTLYLCPQY